MVYNFKYIVYFLLFAACIIGFVLLSENEDDSLMSDPYVIKVTGTDFHWHVVYPGADQEFNTADDIGQMPPIYLPAKTDVTILLGSEDYLYFFELPYFNQTGIAVPDIAYDIHFKTPNRGTYEIRGNQMCGYTHQSLFGDLKILSKSQFMKWQLTNHPEKHSSNLNNEESI